MNRKKDRTQQTISTSLYPLETPVTSPQNTKRSSQNQRRKHEEKDSLKRANWNHDHQPPWLFTDSSDSVGSKKFKKGSSQCSVADSQTEEEIVPSSLPILPNTPDARMTRSKTASDDKKQFEAKMRKFDTQIYGYELEIENIKTQRDQHLKSVSRFQDLVCTDNSTIRIYERTIMRLKMEKEEFIKKNLQQLLDSDD